MAALTMSRPPEILCTCGRTIRYPLAIGLPPVGTESLCWSCLRVWRLMEYGFTDDGGTTWQWSSTDAGADAPLPALRPLAPRGQEEAFSAIAAAVVRAYEEIGPLGAIDYDEELRVLARFDQPEGGHC